ncbi:unnamed protein product [Hermetia illucens]|uniref:Large ribosomal subunit protein uL14m n=1 Tax=Hermetia illucens TaxID=343691 RepID=A0A7R8UW65_HERIL|nr:unnamed protein product [Hermetia illucens]
MEFDKSAQKSQEEDRRSPRDTVKCLCPYVLMDEQCISRWLGILVITCEQSKVEGNVPLVEVKFNNSFALWRYRKLARLRVVDNSDIGDKVLVAIKGEMKKGILVGLKQNQKPKIPKFDSNNLVLIDDNGSPLGTRIHVPIPVVLRTILKEKNTAKGSDYTKLLAIATKLV